MAKLDFSKIKLGNERNQHVTKRLNRQSAWNFFKILWRDNVWRLYGLNFLMLLCILPIVVMVMLTMSKNSGIEQTLPTLNGMGFSTGVWFGSSQYGDQLIKDNNFVMGWLTVLCTIPLAIMFSGGFACVRDAFWTGKLSIVGVFKSMGKGIVANILYGIVSALLMGATTYGLILFFNWGKVVMAPWLAIVLLVLLCIVALIFFVYLMILCSVSVTYQQSVAQNIADSWRLLWLNPIPNVIHFVFALLPLALIFVIPQGGVLYMLYTIFIFMFGGMYFPFVWQTFMMKTFALFYPIEQKKKKDLKAEQDQVQ